MPEGASVTTIFEVLKALVSRASLLVLSTAIAAGSALFLFVPYLHQFLPTVTIVAFAWAGLVFGGLYSAISSISLGVPVVERIFASRQSQGLKLTPREDQSCAWTWEPIDDRSAIRAELNAFNRGKLALQVVSVRLKHRRVTLDRYLHRLALVASESTGSRMHPDERIPSRYTRRIHVDLVVSGKLATTGQPAKVRLALRTQDGREHSVSLRLFWQPPPDH